MDESGKILVSCRMTPEEVVEMERLITHDRAPSRNAWLRQLILGDIEIARDFWFSEPEPEFDRRAPTDRHSVTTGEKT